MEQFNLLAVVEDQVFIVMNVWKQSRCSRCHNSPASDLNGVHSKRSKF